LNGAPWGETASTTLRMLSRAGMPVSSLSGNFEGCRPAFFRDFFRFFADNGVTLHYPSLMEVMG